MKLNITKKIAMIGFLAVGIVLGSVTTLLIPKIQAETTIGNIPGPGDDVVHYLETDPTKPSDTTVTAINPPQTNTNPTTIPVQVPINAVTQAPQPSNPQPAVNPCK